ncbi:MAG: BrnT family toxin [Pyrinomonadaceae bacterium]
MRFEWDETKRHVNLKRHAIDFAEVWQVFENEVVTDVDNRFDYGETRYFTLGLFGGMVVAISHTEDDDIVRLISVRKAEKYEEQIYFSSIRN